METKKFLSLLKHENLTYTEQNFEKGFTETIDCHYFKLQLHGNAQLQHLDMACASDG